jgi:YggT family protein
MSVFITVISLGFQLYEFLILIRVLLTWISTDPYNPVIRHPIVQILHRVTEPVLQPLRRVIPPIGGTVDISPVIALILLEILRRVLVSFLINL